MAGVLRLELLGSARILLDDAPVTGFVSGKALALFCYLAVNGERAHGRAALAGLLWGEATDADAATSLRQALANLRRLLGDYLDVTHQTVAFRRDLPHWLDSAALSAALAAPGTDGLAEAVALYRGPFLADLPVRDAPAFDEWVAGERERLHALATGALQLLVAGALAKGDYATGIRHATCLLALDPWREEAHRQLMLLLARSGQRSAALAQFAACRRALADELGIEPAPETVALYERLRAATPSAARLPATTAPLIGRDAEVAAVVAYLRDPACRLLTVLGPGGIGKTRLALEVAARLAASGHFLNGVAFVPLAAASGRAAVVAAIADACGLAFYGRESPGTQLLGYLRQKEIALVLDNVEQLLAEADLFAALLREAPDVKVLATSRERLQLQGEWVYPLAGLACPPEGAAPGGAVGYSAARLFYQVAERAQPGLALTAGDRGAIDRICRLLEGMPLGIELAAAWAGALPCELIAAEVARDLDFLTTRLRDAPERQRSLRAVFTSSWRRLAAEERRIYRQLTIFRGGFALDAAVAVAEASPPILAGLIDKSLLRRGEGGRYELHEVLRQYAAEELAERGEVADLRARHGGYYAALIARLGEALTGGEQKATGDALARDLENLHAAWRWALERRERAAIAGFLHPLYRFFSLCSRFAEGEALVAEAEGTLADLADPALLGRSLGVRAALCFRADRSAEARDLALRAIDLLTPVPGGERDLALSHQTLGNLAWYTGDYDGARGHYHEALRHAEVARDDVATAYMLNNLGVAESEGHDLAESRRLYEAALVLNRALDNRQGLALVLENFASLLVKQDEPSEAERLRREALALFRELGDRFGEARTLNNLGFAAYGREEHDAAADLLHASLAISQDIGHRALAALTLGNLGLVAGARGEFGAAYHYLRAGVRDAQASRATPFLLASLIALATVRSWQGDHDGAAELVGCALAQPSVNHQTRERGRQLLAELAADSARIAAAQERGRQRALEEVVAAVLGDDADPLVRATRAPAKP